MNLAIRFSKALESSLPEFRSTVFGFMLIVLAGFLSSSCRDSANGPAVPPPSPGHPSSLQTEETHKARFHEYIEMMHLAAPGVNWRDIERRNGLAAMARRHNILQNPQAAGGSAVWRELGSRNLAGRIHAAAWSLDGNSLYAGADRGGLWKGDLDGSNWMPLGDNLYSGVHEVGVVPAPGGGPEILIILYRDWDDIGYVYRSTDQGQSWTVPSGLSNLTGSKRILVLDDNDHTVFLLVSMNGQWQVLVSKDRGASFAHSRDLKTEGDIWTDRTALGPVYMVDEDLMYETADQGQTWTQKGNPIPVKSSLAVLAGSENPNLRFNVGTVSLSGVELWRSKDAGITWSMKKKLDSVFNYWQSLVASTQNENLLSYAGTEMFTSQDGGNIWTKYNDWEQYYLDPEKYLHADVPGLFVFPDPTAPSGERWYIGTDGGLYDSEDQMQSIRNLSLSGLGVSQYYSVLTSRRRPDIILAGSQDQGYQRAVTTGNPPPPPGPWLDFVQLISGDYGHLTSSNGAHDLVYSVHPFFVLAHEGEEDPVIHLPWIDFPVGEVFAWMPYIQADPDNPESFFFCGKYLYRYDRKSTTKWKYKKHSKQNFAPGHLSAIAFSPLDPQRAYAAHTSGKLYYSSDKGKTWTQAANTGPPHFWAYGTTLLPSSKDVNVCWAAGSGYSNAPVMRTVDGGVTWGPDSNGLPSTLVYCMCEAPDQSGMLFCGSENGAWAYDPHTRTWSDILGADAPITTYWACEAVPSQNLVRFGTYSRGIWDYHLNTPGYFPYGELLGGVHVLELSNESAPHIGKPTTFEITGCQPAAHGVLAVSTGAGELPLDGGTLLLDPKTLVTIHFVADREGIGRMTLRIPNSQQWVGAEAFFQAAAQDPGMSKGLALSHGLRASIGP